MEIKQLRMALVALLWLGLLAGCRTEGEPLAAGATRDTFPITPSLAPPTRPPSPTAGPAHSPTPLASTTPTPSASPSPALSPTPSPTPCSPGQVLTRTFPSAVAGAEQAVRIYLPPCYGERQVYPVLYLFAGNIHDESKWDELGVNEAADTAIAAGELPPLLIVMPDGGYMANNTSGGPGSYESVILDDLIPWVETEYCIWAEPAGRAIGGLSRGGYWALEIAFRHPDQFVSVGGHSAALLDQYAGPEINPQYTALNRDLGDLRIYLDIGADDYLRTNTIQLHEDMEANAKPHTWILQEGRHEDTYWAAHVGDYLRWYGEAWPMERRDYPACIG